MVYEREDVSEYNCPGCDCELFKEDECPICYHCQDCCECDDIFGDDPDDDEDDADADIEEDDELQKLVRERLDKSEEEDNDA